ncbi:sigma D regulator [Marinicellulosiphila megalodicopiae]|uniref:sigma D regulator n=1 Tax=Marinicellulosiphila megalodicopiae TaxID=2724896 RepID=UPI003BB1F2D6
MLERCKNAKELWGGVHELIDRWLNERQEVILLYCAIEGLDQYTPIDASIEVKTKAFCQMMMDYVSAGHFEVYEQLFKEAKEFDDGSIELAKEIYPQLKVNTQDLLDFNDKYSNDKNTSEHLNELHLELSTIGELLEDRFQKEDQLIHSLHESHRELIA